MTLALYHCIIYYLLLAFRLLLHKSHFSPLFHTTSCSLGRWAFIYCIGKFSRILFCRMQSMNGKLLVTLSSLCSWGFIFPLRPFMIFPTFFNIRYSEKFPNVLGGQLIHVNNATSKTWGTLYLQRGRFSSTWGLLLSSLFGECTHPGLSLHKLRYSHFLDCFWQVHLIGCNCMTSLLEKKSKCLIDMCFLFFSFLSFITKDNCILWNSMIKNHLFCS